MLAALYCPYILCIYARVHRRQLSQQSWPRGLGVHHCRHKHHRSWPRAVHDQQPHGNDGRHFGHRGRQCTRPECAVRALHGLYVRHQRDHKVGRQMDFGRVEKTQQSRRKKRRPVAETIPAEPTKHHLEVCGRPYGR